MKLKCVAKISSVYWQSNEESVESDKHQRIPVLESRETVRQQQQDKSLEDKQLKKSRRPAAATSSAAAAAAAAAAASSSSFSVSASMSWSRILASKSIARTSLYALPVLIAFLCNAAAPLRVKLATPTPMATCTAKRSNEANGCQHDRCLLAQLSASSAQCR